jgi:hypothetical protein
MPVASLVNHFHTLDTIWNRSFVCDGLLNTGAFNKGQHHDSIADS